MQPTRSIWSKEANCIGQPDEFFFPKKGRPGLEPPYREICNTCPVQRECLNYAVVHKEWGIWGGTTDKEREAITVEIRQLLTQQAIDEGWYEDLFAWYPREQKVPEFPESEFEVEQTEEYFSPLQSFSLEPQVELQVEVPLELTPHPIFVLEVSSNPTLIPEFVL